MSWEKEFHHLSGIYLACRFQAMGHYVIAGYSPGANLEFRILGMIDYALEMKLLLNELSPKEGTL